MADSEHSSQDRTLEPSAKRLADVLVSRGQTEQLQARADAGDRSAAWELARFFTYCEAVEQLRARADGGDNCAAKWLADVLAARGEVENVRLFHVADDSSKPSLRVDAIHDGRGYRRIRREL